MHNSNFEGFACFRAKGTNLNFGWGSIQEWGSIQADTVTICRGRVEHIYQRLYLDYILAQKHQKYIILKPQSIRCAKVTENGGSP